MQDYELKQVKIWETLSISPSRGEELLQYFKYAIKELSVEGVFRDAETFYYDLLSEFTENSDLDRNDIAALSFIAGRAYQRFLSDPG